jgi:hypothetical protein
MKWSKPYVRIQDVPVLNIGPVTGCYKAVPCSYSGTSSECDSAPIHLHKWHDHIRTAMFMIH